MFKEFCVIFAFLLLPSPVLAHATAVTTDFKRLGNQLSATTLASEGYPVPNMQLLVTLSRNGQVLMQKPLVENSQGVYSTQITTIPDGQVRLKLEDNTAGFVPVQTEKVVQWKNGATFQLVLPPSPTAAPEITVIIILAALPIVTALAALAMVMLKRPKGRQV